MTRDDKIRYLNTHDKLSCYNEEDREAVQSAIDLLNIQDKYQWHDLRKNPDDLPPQDIIVLVYVEYENEKDRWYELDTLSAFENGEKNWVYANGEVIAWKYIEPFEEV